jgi:hypothetical protein
VSRDEQFEELQRLREQVKYAQGGQYVDVMQENERLRDESAQYQREIKALQERNKWFADEVERLRDERDDEKRWAKEDVARLEAEVEQLRAALDLVQDSADNEAIEKFLKGGGE